MKICPKCRFLDMEEFGPHDECPKCGIIYAKAEETVRNEKFWNIREKITANEYFRKKAEVEKERLKKEKKKNKTKRKWPFEKIPLDELRPGWTWNEIKNGPKPRKWNFWLWVAMILAASMITALNIHRIFN